MAFVIRIPCENHSLIGIEIWNLLLIHIKKNITIISKQNNRFSETFNHKGLPKSTMLVEKLNTKHRKIKDKLKFINLKADRIN